MLERGLVIEANLLLFHNFLSRPFSSGRPSRDVLILRNAQVRTCYGIITAPKPYLVAPEAPARRCRVSRDFHRRPTGCVCQRKLFHLLRVEAQTCSEEGELNEAYDDITQLLQRRPDSGAVHLVYSYVLW
jgi:hypothetical protein